ncbi:MAG: hypothetical protein NVS3B19_09920 [Ginsengibacter sp.]
MAMKIILFLLLVSGIESKGQHYALLDKTMRQKVRYTNTVTTEDQYNNMFPIEKKSIPEFISALKNIIILLRQKDIPQTLKISIGKTVFTGMKIINKNENRMDIIVSTEYGNRKINMHLCDENVSKASNIFFISTWLDYIKENTK